MSPPRRILVVTFLVLGTTHALAQERRQFTCEQLRAALRQYGWAELLRIAREHNVTRQERAAALACLNRKPNQ